jgi:hypothetical protein
MALGKPAIPPVNALELRVVQTAVSNARQRIEAIEASLGTVSATVQAASGTSVSLNALRAQVALLATEIGALLALLSNPANGIVVKSGSALITRTLVEGANITITNADGTGGDPVISAITPSADGVLYDGEGRAMLTGDGHAILV